MTNQRVKKQVYKFIERRDVKFYTNLKHREFNNQWLNITNDGVITVKGTHSFGYAWNGCSPKKEALDLVFGTPDGRLDLQTGKPVTYFASMLHDILYQFKDEIMISRSEADELFHYILKNENFFWSGVYFVFVRAFGWIFGKWQYKHQLQTNLEVLKITI